MRYLLGADEERRFLLDLVERHRLTPLVPEGKAGLEEALASDPGPIVRDRRDMVVRTVVLWASALGPLSRLSDRGKGEDAGARVMLALNPDPDAVDLERTPILTWSRPVWYDDAQQWITPSRLGATRTPLSQMDPEVRRLHGETDRRLRRGGRGLNSWDIPGSEGEGAMKFTRPRNVRSYSVTIWPDAEIWLSTGVRLYHWDP